jgi:Uma2 family endonuclease
MSAMPRPKPEPVYRPELVVYPESDGKPMADNTLQFRWIQVLAGNLMALYREQDVFVAGDLLWYPVRDQPKVVNAPDVLLAFGRPRGHRGSYRQWQEADVAPQVVFEVLSPSNGYAEMIDKQLFYDEANRLAELGRKARRGEASAEEIAELERLEGPAP